MRNPLTGRACTSLAAALPLFAGLAASAPAAAEDAEDARPSGVLEEVIVTAQRREESVQEVPIAVTALSATMLEDRQVIGTTDLQMNAPNVSFTATNFGSTSLSIRGIGRLVTASSGDAGVSIHTNDIAMGTNLAAAEFYDMERIEILRGPQGTLYGRNATGGVVNFITAQPRFDGITGFIDGEAGNYEHRRLKGGINLPLSETFAVRFAGMVLQRDGYIENLAADQGVPGVDNDIDGRDLNSWRLTARWDMTERMSGWAQYQRLSEDDDKARIINQVCKANDLPTAGCLPDEVGFDGVHNGSTTGGMFMAFAGALPPGANTAAQGLNFAFQRPDNIGLRKIHTDFEPVYKYNEDNWTGGLTYDFDSFRVSLIGGFQETEYLSRQDYNMDVGAQLNPIVAYDANAFFAGQNPLGFGAGIVLVNEFPTSDIRGGLNAGGCELQAGTLGVEGGCSLPGAPTDRVFSYDQSDSESEYWTAELKINSDFEGRFNFLAGINYGEAESEGNYFVVANSLDVVTSYGSPFFGFPPLYPGVFDSHSSGPGYEFDSLSYFGEVYFDISDRLKFTVGLRYNDDEKLVRDAGYLFNSIGVSTACFGSGLGGDCSALAPLGLTPLTEKIFVRTPFLADQYIFGAPASAAVQGLIDLYGLTDQAAAAVTLDDRLAVARAVPLAPTTGEARILTGSPSEDDNQEVTGRIGLDWQVTDDVLVFGFFSRGYKPAGFNPPVNPDFQANTPFTFDNEQVDAFELGVKSVLLDGSMIVNASFFTYEYEGLQIASIQNNTAVNQNVDADIYGFEAEVYWKPQAVENLAIDFNYSYLNTEVASGTFLLDTVDRTQGDPNLILLKNIDPGSNTGINYVATVADAAAATSAAIAAGAAVNLPGVANYVDPTGTNADGIPAYYSRNFLQAQFDAGAIGAAPNDGVLLDLGGNHLPNSPEHTIKLGVAYTFPLRMGNLTARWDYYWQDDSFSREYNRVGDVIESWDQHNASLIFESVDGQWQARAWVRNIQDEDNVTGHYVTSDTSGLFRNYFLTEPRIYGASLRFEF